jgi:hypothetical protein
MGAMTNKRWWLGVTAGLAVGLGGVVVADQVSTPANAAPFTVSVSQLQINQRISQAAVRRSNESLKLLGPVRASGNKPGPGWPTSAIRNGAVTTEKLATAVRESQPRWAVVAATTGTLVRAKGASAAAKLTDPGLYSVTFDRDISACAIQATIAATGTDPITAGGEVSAWRSAADAKVVTVRTAAYDGSAVPPAVEPSNTLPFHVTVLC